MSTSARISLFYLIAGGLWVGFSNLILGLPPAATIVGWLFVALTAGVLYAVLRREFETRERAVKTALEREASFHDLFANNPLPMWVYESTTLACLDVNKAACLHYGYEHDEFLKMRITDMRPADERLRLMSYIEEQGAGFQDVGEWRHATKTGEIIEVETAAQPLDFSGKQSVLVVIQDITERKRNEAARLANEKQQLVLAQETELNLMRSRFMALISHEFRRPLTTITSSIDLLENYRDKMSDEGAHKHFNRIHEQLDEMLDLLNDLLALMRLETGEQEFKPTEVSLTDLCQKLTGDAELSIRAGHAIRYITDCASVVISGDQKLLRHALGNLLSNAVKYSPEGGEVRLELTHNQSIRIRVSDQGIGIPAKDQEHIFDPFYRASNVGETGGTGLGLAIAKKAVESHGGTLELARSDSTGTEFLITLPINEHVFLTGC